MIIRSAALSDLSALLDLYRTLHPQEPSPNPAKAQAVRTRILASGDNPIIVAEIGLVLVASCALATIPNLTRDARSYGMIENVVMHPDYRRRGLGRAVIAAALDTAWRSDCYKVVLATGSTRAETLRFYDGCGLARGGKMYFEAGRA